jgi:hypothetical protein
LESMAFILILNILQERTLMLQRGVGHNEGICIQKQKNQKMDSIHGS